MAKICLVLTGNSLLHDMRALEQYRPFIDMAELRGDYLEPEEYQSIRRFPGMAGLPVILTINGVENGGLFRGGERDRAALFNRAFSGIETGEPHFAFVDIDGGADMGELEKTARSRGTRIIRSLHDFHGTPRDLAARVRALSRTGDEILKAAVMPRSLDDTAFLIETARAFSGREKVFIAMGKLGASTRILTEQTGSAWTFAYPLDIPDAQASAPGQLSPKELCEFYRFREINDYTAVYGILGWPLDATSSPALFNRAFAHENMNAVYLPFPSDSVGPFMRLAETIHLQGAAVTVPHKKAALPWLNFQSEEVRRIGACNTIIRGDNGWHGYNTDAPGFSGSLLCFLGREDLSGMNVTIAGAGGAASAVAWEVARLGGRGLVVNRTPDRARELASRYRFDAAALKAGVEIAIAGYSDLIINTTRAGMEPDIENDPLEMYAFKGHETVMDLIYKPEQTLLLRRAAGAGCMTLNGYDMLVRQARYQFNHFFGRDFPAV